MNIRSQKKSITYPLGFQASGIASGIKKHKRDMGLLVADEGSIAAGVFTTHKFPAAPLKVCKEHLASSRSFRAVIVTSGNANAGTGRKGLAQSREETRIVADHLGCRKEEVLVLSTGKIGVLLPMDKIRNGVPRGLKTITGKGGADFSRAILTTDTFAKNTAYNIETGGKSFRIAGTAKGAGMIRPDMATMLAFITTDAPIAQPLLKQALKEAVSQTFNRITVDGCMSTNDTVLLISSRQAEFSAITQKCKNYDLFCKALIEVCADLAWMIVLDGEGMTKVIEITVKKAASEKDARSVAEMIADSNLFKSAIFGESANWGRIFAAVGASQARMKESLLNICFCGETVMKKGEPVEFSRSVLNKKIKKKIITVEVDLGMGKKSCHLSTVDLTTQYVNINKD